MKTCPNPKCGSHKIIIFDSDNNYCQKCNEWFPAVAEEECIAGCRVYANEEIKHHKDCLYYPESLSKMHDDFKTKHMELITKLADDIWAVGKKLESREFETSKELKVISGCLHDIRAERDTEWYKKFKIDEEKS